MEGSTKYCHKTRQYISDSQYFLVNNDDSLSWLDIYYFLHTFNEPETIPLKALPIINNTKTHKSKTNINEIKHKQAEYKDVIPLLNDAFGKFDWKIIKETDIKFSITHNNV